jgi:hypothetical protein
VRRKGGERAKGVGSEAQSCPETDSPLRGSRTGTTVCHTAWHSNSDTDCKGDIQGDGKSSARKRKKRLHEPSWGLRLGGKGMEGIGGDGSGLVASFFLFLVLRPLLSASLHLPLPTSAHYVFPNHFYTSQHRCRLTLR